MRLKRVYAVVQGQVQGVGFRWTVQMNATALHLTGWVRNMSNGMVEMEAQGEEKDLDAFLIQIRKKDRFIRVDDLSCKTIPLRKDEKEFRVTF